MPGAIRIVDLVNHFLAPKDSERQRGEITDRTFSDYICTGKLIVKQFGKRDSAEGL